MNTTADTQSIVITPHRIVSALIFGAMLFPVLGILGWLTGVRIVASFGEQFIPMAPSTAISFLLLSLSFYLLLLNSHRFIFKHVAVVVSVLVASYGALTFIGTIAELPIVPDNFLFAHMGTIGGKPIGRMAPSTAILFLLSGISLFSISQIFKNNNPSTLLQKMASWSAIVVAMVGLLFIVGYGFSQPLFYGGSIIPMALPTASSFLLLGSGLAIIATVEFTVFHKQIAKMRDLGIGVQLRLGFAALLAFVIVLGVVSYVHNKNIQKQIETIYNHPLKVRRALGSIESDIFKMRLSALDLLIANDVGDLQETIHSIDFYANDALKQFDILSESYLGPKSDIEEALDAFLIWKSSSEVNNKRALSGEVEKIKESMNPSGKETKQQDVLDSKIKKISLFALQKTESLYVESGRINGLLTRQMILLIVSILLLSLLINYTLIKNIRSPLLELTRATKRFKEGDFSARSSYLSQNEIGVLSESFNQMAEKLQFDMSLNERIADLSSLMLVENDIQKFFPSILSGLARHTRSQMVAVYLRSDDKKQFVHFHSIGLDDKARQSFDANAFSGEFGPVIATRKIQHIKNISSDTHFAFPTVGGTFRPNAILTVPIVESNEIVAIISLASLTPYRDKTLQLIDKIHITLSSRIAGILALRKIKEFTETLEQQNIELEAQKTELSSQSTELIIQNNELEMQKNQLDEASRLKTVFLSNMSHELRTPLNSVIALSGVLSRRLNELIPDEEHSYLEVIERNGKHLLDLINDILDISRIEAGREEFEITSFNINFTINEVVSMISPQVRGNKIQLINTTSEENITLNSDAEKIKHILQNIIANAVKFTEKGKVEVIATRNTNSVTVTIIDTGIGISEKHLPHIFDEFRQADSGTSRKYGGTGLGLAIAKKYANLLGGDISVKSNLGVGSEFTVILPITYSSEKTFQNDVHPVVNSHQHRTIQSDENINQLNTILLVDDSEPAIIQMKDILEERKYRIIVARDGQQAIDVINQTIPDAIILDLMMPGTDGFEVLKKVREAEPTAHIPVLILTAKHITKDELKFLKRNNIHQLIQKGNVNRDELLNAVQTMVISPTTESLEPKREPQLIDGKPVVLVVEDNRDNLLTVKALLAGNFTVIEAVDGRMGVEIAKQNRPDLILMDIQLPELDGISAFKMIRNEASLQHVPVIALTASAMTSERETILAHGFDAYISKPIEEKYFNKTINEILYGQ